MARSDTRPCRGRTQRRNSSMHHPQISLGVGVGEVGEVGGASLRSVDMRRVPQPGHVGTLRAWSARPHGKTVGVAAWGLSVWHSQPRSRPAATPRSTTRSSVPSARSNAPIAGFQVVSDHVPRRRPTASAIEELERRIKRGERDVVLLGATETRKSATTALAHRAPATPDAGDGADQDAGRAAGPTSCARCAAEQRRRVLRLHLLTTTNPEAYIAW